MKTSQHVKLRSLPSLAHKQKKNIALARRANSQRAWRNKKPVLTLSAVTDEEGHPWEHEDESGRTILFSKLLMTSIGLLTKLSLMISLLPRKTQSLDLMEFSTVSTDVLVALVQSSSFMLIKPLWREEIFLIVLLKVGQSSSLEPLIPMTLERKIDYLMHFGR